MQQIEPKAQEPAAKRPLRFGASLSLTGSDYALQGGYMKEGYLLFEQRVNVAGGILGKPIEFVIYDDSSNPATAVKNYQRLIADGVDVLLGPYGSTMTEAVADLMEEECKLLIAPTAGMTTSWTKGRKYLVKMLGALETAGAGILELALQREVGPVVLVAEASPVTEGLAEAAAAAANAMGLEVALRLTFAKGSSDFTPQLKQLKNREIGLLAIISLQLDDIATLIAQVRGSNINPRMMTCLPYGMLSDFLVKVGKDADYMYNASPWDPNLPYAGASEFVHAYRETYGRTPAVQSAAAYAACEVLKTAIERAGSTEQDTLRDAVFSLKTETVLGDFAVDERGFQIGQKAVTTQWQGGKQVLIWPMGYAAGAARFPTPPWTERRG